MKALIYNITLNEPTLMTRLEGDPNSATSYDFLPGSVLRGLLIARYAKGTTLTLDETTRRLFFDGTTRYLNGYPLDGDTRSLPMPRAWHQPKTSTSKTTTWRDFSQVTPSDEEQKDQWKRAGEVFWVKDEVTGQVIRQESLHHISIHTQRDRAAGRPRQDGGAVFRYDALAASQTFQAVILCKAADASLLQQLIEQEGLASAGGSRNAGYGLVTLQFVAAKDDWQETPARQETYATGQLKITLLSDALIRDANGQFATDAGALAKAIKTRLGIEEGTVDAKSSFTSIGLVGGFNRKWGLPLPQTPSFEAGSVLVLKDTTMSADLDKKISALEEAGIGERRAEGFGRVAVNWLNAEEWIEAISDREANSPQDKQDKPQERVPVEPLPKDSLDQRLAQVMVNRLHKKRMSEIIKARAAKISLVNPPNKSQVSQLRETLQKAVVHAETTKIPAQNAQQTKEPVSDLKEHLEHVNERSVTRRQFERARVVVEGSEKRQKLDAWLLTDILGCDIDEKLIALLGMKSDALPAVNVAGITAKRNADCQYYALQLALEVMRRTNKTRQDGEA